VTDYHREVTEVERSGFILSTLGFRMCKGNRLNNPTVIPAKLATASAESTRSLSPL
jgi:hypothetical protein